MTMATHAFLLGIAFIFSTTLVASMRIQVTHTQSQASREASRSKLVSPLEDYILGTRSWLYRTECTGESYRGLVVYFHGFSASPAQIRALGPKLQEACLDVFSPVLPGHGGRVTECGSRGECTVKFNDTHGFDLRELPYHGQEYQDFAEQIGDLAEEDLKLQVKLHGAPEGKAVLMLLGLSLGSSLSYAASAAKPGRFARQLLVNPFFGSGMEAIDVIIGDCIKAGKPAKECASVAHNEWIRQYAQSVSVNGTLGKVLNHVFIGDTPGEVQASVMTDLERASDWIPEWMMDRAQVMNVDVIWGQNCEDIVEQGMQGYIGGFCAFQQKHLLAAHAFAINALKKRVPGHTPPITQILTTERDGITRNGLTYSLAGRLYSNAPYGKGVSMCMFPFKAGIDLHDNGQYWSDDYSMPHANLGKTGWWEPKLSDNIVRFFTTIADNIGEAPAEGDRNVCEDMPLTWGAHVALSQKVLPEADPAWSQSTPWPDPPMQDTTHPVLQTLADFVHKFREHLLERLSWLGR